MFINCIQWWYSSLHQTSVLDTVYLDGCFSVRWMFIFVKFVKYSYHLHVNVTPGFYGVVLQVININYKAFK